jgi:DNA-directed RNA polymerase specialized sigma24 family protein
MELVDAGCSWAEAARLVGVPKGTVGTWVRKRTPL